MSAPLPSAEEIRQLPPDGGPEFNRLIHSRSPYLLQHARNPVDWYPWGPEAFERARREGKPLFVSIGYSTCHWCHVMEAESFERADVAQVLNAHFLSVKVDREERPDLDELYMTATQLLTGRGGWPNSVWLMPDGRPWYAGTYFPREDRDGMPGFKSVLKQLTQIWSTRRTEVEEQAGKLAEAMKRVVAGQGAVGHRVLSRALPAAAFQDLRENFDETFGGFGGAPKFPPHGGLRLLFAAYDREHDEALLRMATFTLDAMAHGGIHDHVGGGFHRYATDLRWFLPHFEKMLYDNAQLARAYVEGYRCTRDEEYRRTARAACDWVLRDMTDPDGGFYSGLDADSEGVEGKFYVWTRREILDALGAEAGEWFCRLYGVEEGGNYREEATGKATGANILYLHDPLPKAASGLGPGGSERLEACRRTLEARRRQRVWPHRDDKVLAGWNGLMIGALAFAGEHLAEPRYTQAAERAADFILTRMRRDGRLLRSYRQGEAAQMAFLDDYAFMADGLLDLHSATGDTRRIEEAKELMAVLDRYYLDRAGGGYFLTADDHEELLIRSKSPYDQAIPSGNGVAARVWVRLAGVTGERKCLDAARRTLDAFLSLMENAPRGTESLLLAAALFLDAQESGGLASAPEQEPVRVEVIPSAARAVPGESLTVRLRVSVASGYHINSDQPMQEHLAPAAVTLDKDGAATLDAVRFPPGKRAEYPAGGPAVSAYEGTIFVDARLTVRPDAPIGTVQLRLTLHAQACSDRACLAPKTLPADLTLDIVRAK